MSSSLENIALQRKELNNSLAVPAVIPSLDGWRAVAILIVFVSHAGLGGLIPGGFGVTLFFFLSGYLITTLMQDEYQKSGTISIKKFYIRRFLRLALPLLLTLILSYSLTYLGLFNGGVSLLGFLSQLLYLFNYYSIFWDHGNTIPDGSGVFWSLSVEEHFYLLFPISFLYLYSSKTKISWIVISLLSCCLCVLAWRYILVIYYSASVTRTYYSTDTRIDSIIYGAVLALMFNPLSRRYVEKKFGWIDVSLIGISISTILLTFLVRSDVFRETIRYTLQGVALMPVFFYSIRYGNTQFFCLLNNFVVATLGRYSYSVYLIHLLLLKNILFSSVSTFVNVFLIALLTLAYAWFIDRYIDRPLLPVRRRFR